MGLSIAEPQHLHESKSPRPLKKRSLNKKERKENLPYLSTIFSSFPEQNPCTSSKGDIYF